MRSNTAMVAEPIYCLIVDSVGAQLPSCVHNFLICTLHTASQCAVHTNTFVKSKLPSCVHNFLICTLQTASLCAVHTYTFVKAKLPTCVHNFSTCTLQTLTTPAACSSVLLPIQQCKIMQSNCFIVDTSVCKYRSAKCHRIAITSV